MVVVDVGVTFADTLYLLALGGLPACCTSCAHLSWGQCMVVVVDVGVTFLNTTFTFTLGGHPACCTRSAHLSWGQCVVVDVGVTFKASTGLINDRSGATIPYAMT